VMSVLRSQRARHSSMQKSWSNLSYGSSPTNAQPDEMPLATTSLGFSRLKIGWIRQHAWRKIGRAVRLFYTKSMRQRPTQTGGSPARSATRLVHFTGCGITHVEARWPCFSALHDAGPAHDDLSAKPLKEAALVRIPISDGGKLGGPSTYFVV